MDTEKRKASSRWKRQTEDWEEREELRGREPDAYEGRHKKEKRKKKRLSPLWSRLIKIFLILLAAFLGLFLWLNRENLHPETVVDWLQEKIVGMGVGDGYPTPIVGSTVAEGNFASSNGDLVAVSDTHLTVMNSSAKELMSRQHSFTTPALKLAGTRMLVYNLGGKGYQVESYTKTLVKKTGEETIFGGGISSEGTYALLTEAEGYFGKLTVYTPENEERFRYRFSSVYPTAVAVDGISGTAFVTGVSSKDGALLSSLYLLDMNSTESQKPLGEYEDTLFLDAYLCPDGTAVAVGDTRTVVIPSGGSPQVFEYGSRQLASYDVGDDVTALCLLPYDTASSGELILLGHDGAVRKTISVGSAMESVSISGNTAAVLGGGVLSGYSISDGSPVGQADAGSDSVAVALRDETTAYILGVSEIRMVTLSQ